MRKLVRICALCVCLVGCGVEAGDKTAALRRRAKAFGSLLVRIQGMEESDAKWALERFIEPSPSRADRIARYYREFSAGSEKFKIVSFSIDKITIHSDRTSAEVTYRTIARTPEGTELPFLQATQWRLVDGQWYRVVGESKKKLDRR